jgi:hypothetical protein
MGKEETVTWFKELHCDLLETQKNYEKRHSR